MPSRLIFDSIALVKINTFGFFLVILIVAVFVAKPVSAQDASSSASSSATTLKFESVNPGDEFKFFYKRLTEKISLFFLSPFPEKKGSFLIKTIDSRLAELSFVAQNKDISNIQTTSQRYFTTVGNATDFVLSHKLSPQKQELQKKLTEQLDVIKQLETNFNDTTAEWRFLQHDFEYVKDYLSQLSK